MTFETQKFLSLFSPGTVIYVGGSCAEPHGLLDLLEANRDSLADLRFIQQPLGAVNKRDLSSLSSKGRQRTFFMTPYLQDSLAAGRVEFVPMHMRTIFDYLASTRIDIALLQAARDKNGFLRFGPNVDYVDAVLTSARDIVIEVNTAFTASQGAPAVDESRIAMQLELESLEPLYPSGEIDNVSAEIGRLIATLIRDGDCLQTGIGAVPAAILNNLTGHNDLGFHGGLMDDGIMKLIQAGNINGSRKAIDRGKHILGMALGSRALLDWLAEDPKGADVLFRSADYTHDFGVIGQLDNFVSVNSAVEIDLMGQVNAEVAGSKQISGTGGSVDFMRASKAANGGRSIVAMASTARGGTVSRVVPKVSVVTALRTDVDIVVTEHGIADLRNEPLAVRAEKLIQIAHPDFRDELRSN